MNARSRHMGWAGLAILMGACWAAPALAGDKGPGKQTEVREFVYLTESRPVLVRLHIRVDGKPIQTAFDGFLKYLFTYLDVNGDGVLDKDEAERVPTVAQLRSGLQGRGGFDRRPARPGQVTPDIDKDGKVTLAELADYYRKSGFAPFQVQIASTQANPLGAAAAIFGGAQSEPTVAAIREASFKLLDTNRDGKLSKAELAAAPKVLLRQDEDEDEIVTARELAPDTGKSSNPFGAIQMMAGAVRGGSSDASKTVALLKPGEAPDDLVTILQERYGRKAKDPAKLSQEDLGLDRETFRRLDGNKDGVLDARELAGFVKLTPDVELALRLGQKKNEESSLALVPARGKPSPLAGKLTARNDVAQLDLGTTRLDLRTGEEESEDLFGSIIREQTLVQLKQADKDGNGVIDAEEAKNSRRFRGLYKLMDRDGDGKVTEKELLGYLDHVREAQTRARSACAALIISDESRGLFDLLDVDRDGRLGVREMRGAIGLLPQLDVGKKGHLSKSDIPRRYKLLLRRGPVSGGDLDPAAAFRALYGGGNRYETGTELTAGPLWFRKMDRNRDGDVSRKEFLFSDQRFRALDTDGDGLISAEEATKADAQGGK